MGDQLKKLDSHYYKSFEWRVKWGQVRARDNYRCRYCGHHATCVDHIIPRRVSFDDGLGNLVASCSECNLIAKDFTFDSFDEKRDYVLMVRRAPRLPRVPSERSQEQYVAT